MAAAGVALGAFKAIGAIQQGEANAQMAEYNARVAQQNAAIVQAQGAEAERRSRVNSGKQIGGMVAAYGASGVTADGSAMDVVRNSAANAELNALTIRNNADIKATSYKNEASLDYYRATNDRTSGYLNALSSFIPGLGSMGGGGGGGGESASAEDLSAEAEAVD